MLSDRDYMQPGQGRLHRPTAPVSLVKPLLWANAILFVLTGFGRNALVEFMVLTPAAFRSGQVWRLFTYMFAHAGLFHILFNMWGLYIFGIPLERRLGPRRFAHLYVLSGLVGGAVWLAANWTGPQGVIGASGAVFGVMMAAAMVFPNERILLLFPPIPMRLKTFVFVFAMIEVLLALDKGGGRIAHIAHLGGLLGAFFYMNQLRRAAQRGRPAPRARSADPRGAWRRLRAWWRRQQFQKTPRTKTSREPEPDAHLNTETDRVLDKIGRSGLGSLTATERRVIDRARERLRDRNG